MSKKEGTVTLKVLEAYTRDVGMGIARIDYDAMDALDASTGGIIEVRGKRRTVAKCLPLYPTDEGKGVIRIDSLTRVNAAVAIGDTVAIRKIKAPSAEKVIVAPLEAIPPIDERYLAEALEIVPVAKGDNVMIPYFGGRLTFQVLEVSPTAEAVVISRGTLFTIESALPSGVIRISSMQDLDRLSVDVSLGERRLSLLTDSITVSLTVAVRYGDQQAEFTHEVSLNRSEKESYARSLGYYRAKVSESLQMIRAKIADAVKELGEVTVSLEDITKLIRQSLS